MDLNLQPGKAAEMKDSLSETDRQSAKSSNSSIYSSPTTTPTNDQPVLSQHHQADQTAEQLPPNSTPAYYEDLVTECKLRMANKFDQLEKETGLTLNQEGMCLVTSPPSNGDTPLEPHSTNHVVTPKSKDVSQPSVPQMRNLEYVRMEKELRRLKEELVLKNEIVDKMCKIRSQVESELEDLTASLFEEANKMVYKANVLRDRAEKDLVEANLKIDMLTAEVDALKLLVITSTPSRPNAHLHPQLNSPKRSGQRGERVDTPKTQKQPSMPTKSPSNYELGKEMAANRSGEQHQQHQEQEHCEELRFLDESSQIGEIEPIYFEEFLEWRKSPTLEPMKSDFMKRIYDEEIYPVFNFKNRDLTAAVLRCIESNSLTVESVAADTFPRKCALLEVPRTCSHRMKLHDGRWYSICQLSRNRIAAVCDLFCYLGYIKSGLVKSDAKHMYWQIMKRRHSIVTSKLGFQPSCAH